MKTIIAGGRDINLPHIVEEAVQDSGFLISEIVSGRATGVDTLGENWALENKLPIAKFPADWNKHGKSAGYIRNSEMAKYAEALIAIWNGKSKGTKNMIDTANRLGLKVYIHMISSSDPHPIKSP
jgi:hypothetical protein